MEEFDETLEKAKSQLLVWKAFLNSVIGVFSFSLGIGCLGTNDPPLYASISILFVVFVILSKMFLFPKVIKELRSKKNKTDVEEVFLLGLEKKFFSVKAALTGYFVYLLGFSFLIVIAFDVLK